MAVANKVLVETVTLSTSQTTQYTVPANVVATLLDKVTATNYSTVRCVVNVNLIPVAGLASDQNKIVMNRSLAPGQTYTFPELVGQTLTAGMTISTITDVAAAVNFRVSGREIT